MELKRSDHSMESTRTELRTSSYRNIEQGVVGTAKIGGCQK